MHAKHRLAGQGPYFSLSQLLQGGVAGGVQGGGEDVLVGSGKCCTGGSAGGGDGDVCNKPH